jgi:Uma2 family endonuclease
MAEPAKKIATYADIEALPPHVTGEIIYGNLVTHPRPTPRHATAHNALGSELTGPFQTGRGGPGGWVFMTEPEMHIGGHILVPDIAGWRREKMPDMPSKAYVEIAPDWVCEILSESTEDYDRKDKREIYGKLGVSHIWLLDPRSKVLEVFQLTAGHWMLIGTYKGHDGVKAPPFNAIEFSLGALWPFDKPLQS